MHLFQYKSLEIAPNILYTILFIVNCISPLIGFLISALYIYTLFASIACLYRMLPHLSPFLQLFLTLSFPLRIDPLRFQTGCRKRRLNLALVFVFILGCSTFLWLVNACFCCAKFCSFPYQAKKFVVYWLWVSYATWMDPPGTPDCRSPCSAVQWQTYLACSRLQSQ